jgi:hypothetical protein
MAAGALSEDDAPTARLTDEVEDDAPTARLTDEVDDEVAEAA